MPVDRSGECMSTVLSLLLVISVAGALVEGFRQGVMRAALRLAATLLGLMFAALMLRIALESGFARNEWMIFLVYLVMFGLGSGLLDAFGGRLVRQFRSRAPDAAEDADRPRVGPFKVHHVTKDVAVIVTGPERFAGMILNALNAALGGGVFVLALKLLPVTWIAAAVEGSSLAARFVDVARSVSFLLPPEIRP